MKIYEDDEKLIEIENQLKAQGEKDIANIITAYRLLRHREKVLMETLQELRLINATFKKAMTRSEAIKINKTSI